MITIEEALRIAVNAHEGQKDLDGKPAILHPLTVGLAGKNREEMIAGFLHDVLEDSGLTLDELHALGVDEPVIEALKLLTHDKTMPYEDYVQRIIDSGNAIALAVKTNDLTHNLARGRAGGHTKQVTKHEKAMNMIKKATLLPILLATLALASCTSHYQVSTVSRQRLVVDSRYDQQPDERAAAFLAPYKQKVDSVMSPVMGTAARDMDKQRPESEISNLLSDILIWASKDYGEKPVFAIYNMGGIRAALIKGTVTYGDINDIAPFENKICFLTLTGEKVLELFSQIARRQGEGVSHGVELVIKKDGQLVSALLHGKPINPAADYRVATIDYLVQGNDGMPALRDGTDVRSPQNEKDNTRFLIMNYFKTMQAQGKAVDARVEGRVRIVE